MNDDLILTSPKMSEQVYNIIINRIASGIYKKGQKLSTNELAEELNVSRSPIKEAFNTLYTNGIIQISDRRGHYVRQFTTDEINAVYEFREILETYAFMKINKKIPLNAYTALKGILQMSIKILKSSGEKDRAEIFGLSTQFHFDLFKLCGNQFVFEHYKNIYLMTQIYKTTLTIESQQEHLNILDQLYTGTNTETIQTIVKKHLALGKTENLQG
jgi:DNA-binding GntR family transcriptional regulator